MNASSSGLNRRQFAQLSLAGMAVNPTAFRWPTPLDATFELNYMLASCMYGYTALAEILPETAKVGASAIDIWPKVHGDQREQLDELGEEQFARMLDDHDVTLGCITQYKLGPFDLQQECALAERLGCRTIISGAKGPRELQGEELKAAVKQFVDRMRPHLEVAGRHQVTIAIENHAGSLLSSPDSIRWFLEFLPDAHLQLALAPYHLPQDPQLLAELIRESKGKLAMFYAWQHGMGCMEKLPKEQELLQMPGRGELDFRPLIEALSEIAYDGWTEIFMHPVPRGIPILETTEQVTAEINRARDYLAECGAEAR